MTPPKILQQIALLAVFSMTSHAETILGTGTGALLGGDLTDPENDGVDVEDTAGTNFNWTSISASSKTYFSDSTAGGVNEGAFDIFDNKVGPGEAKFCCDGAPMTMTVQLPESYVLTHFTATSSNDSPGRDPDVWSIQGSTDGVNWIDIFVHDADDPTQTGDRLSTHAGNFWTARNQVIRFDGAGVDFDSPTAYSWFRIRMDSATAWPGGGGNLALGELELFGLPGATADPEITSIDLNGTTATVVMKGNAGVDYYLVSSPDLISWDTSIIPANINGAPFQTDENGDLTIEVDVAVLGSSSFFRIQETEPGG